MLGRKRTFVLRTLQVSAVTLLSLTMFAQVPVQNSSPSVQNAQSASKGNQARLAGAGSSTNLESGDLLEISVFGVPDLSTKVRISNSGDVYLPLIDYVHLAGLSVDEAQELIEKRLEDGGFVRGPHVSIFVDESASQAISVLGEVSHPGPYPSIGDPRLYDLISAAGGLTEKAGRTVTIVHRSNPDQKTEIVLPSNLAEDTTGNVEVQPGDTIIVSHAGIVYVVGDVQHPSGFFIQDNTLTVAKALALAGGATRTSSLNGCKILRESSSGTQEIAVRLKDILHAKSRDIALMKGDILFVPGSAVKGVGYRTAEAAASLTTALTVVAVRP